MSGPLNKVRAAVLSEHLHELSVADDELRMLPCEAEPLRRLAPADAQPAEVSLLAGALFTICWSTMVLPRQVRLPTVVVFCVCGSMMCNRLSGRSSLVQQQQQQQFTPSCTQVHG